MGPLLERLYFFLKNQVTRSGWSLPLQKRCNPPRNGVVNSSWQSVTILIMYDLKFCPRHFLPYLSKLLLYQYLVHAQ